MHLEDKLDGFCQPVSLFWDGAAASANGTSSPDFTLCFEDTVILGGVCFVFWLAAAVKLLVVRGKTRISRSLFNWLLVSKLVLLLLPLLTAVCDFFFHISQAQRANYQYLSPLVLACTMVVAAAVLVHERHTRTRSSAILFLFWLGMVIYGSIRARTLALRKKEQDLQEHPLLLTTFSLQYTVYVVELILSMVPERLVMPPLAKGQRKPCPENYVTFLSRISFWWLNSLLWRGWKRPMEDSDLTDLNPQDKSAVLSPAFEKNWEHEMRKAEGEAELRSYHPVWSRLARVFWCVNRKKKKTPSLVLALVKTYWRILLSGGLLKLVHDLLNFVSPQILRLMIGFVSNPEEAAWKGYVYAALLFVVAMIQAAFLQQYFHRGYTVGMRMRTVLTAAVYKKSLRLSNTTRKESTVGEIVNLMSVDTNRMMRLMSYVHNLWSGPFQIVLAIIFLWVTIGPSVLAGLATAIILMPINMGLAAWRRRYQVKQLAEKDNRIKVVNEVLSGIKVIKLYAWEVPYEEKIMGIRKAELSYLKKDAVVRSAFSFMWASAPMLITLVTLGTYVLVHLDDPNERLTPEKAFVTLSLLNILNFPLTVLPWVIGATIQASVSVKRLGKFLRGEELDPDTVEWSPKPAADTEDAVSMVGAQFTWDSAERPALSDLNLHVKPGQLVAVVGQVGAGKSSLISAMLGEMEKLTGRVAVQGSIAYVPQQPWILNATLKDNILFGKEEDEELYQATLHNCALEPDLEVLPRGDLAEIGEKGINLSGGQKQRVSLARAAYQEAEVYLLDDPLSAVDSHVGKHIFDKVIGPEGMLRDKVRILNTHAVTFLPQCDHIVVMEDGRISEQGSYSELMERNGSFAEYLRTYSSTEQDKDKETKEEEVKGEEEKKKKGNVASTKNGSLITEEKAETGRVHMSVLLAYCKACTYVLSLLTILLCVASNGFTVGSYFWLAEFSNVEGAAAGNGSVDTDVGYYLGIYALLGVLQTVFVILGSLTLVIGSLLGAKALHNAMLRNILRSPMSFFDTTPLGRILNRFSLDVDTIDEVLPETADSFIHCLFNVLNVLIIIAIITPIFLVAAVPLGIFYWFIQRFYVATSRQLKRLESTTRSPIYSQFQETLNGVSSIRAYRQQGRFNKDNERKVDNNIITYYPNICINRWLAMRLEFVGNLVVFLAAFFAAVQRNHEDDLHLRINAGLVGLSISYALQLTNTLNWMVRMSSELETNIIAVERVKEYSETPTEAAAVVESHRPSSGWPQAGRVTFHHYSAKYREELDLALSDISLDVAPGTKVGIVGRTGAGKSSLSLGLFRIMEAASGSITVDEVDVASIGLQDLRSRITIIPQDPVLFSGSIRMNLDPFDNYTDPEIWKALESAHLSSFISGLPESLGHLVTEGGENLSVGQRQLVCLARALLRKTKILVLDEATAAVDLETDDLIQKTIRTEFADCTILTIAHRINTIMDYDRVVVLDKGRMVEYDTIPALLQQPQGYFASLAREAGVVNS